jgi:flagellar P-ring protein precursor FlgI
MLKTVLKSSLVALFMLQSSVYADRIKDLTDIAGVRTNQLVGYGLVAGLSGTGDGKDLPLTGQSLRALLSGLGVSVDSPISEFDLGDSLMALAGQNANQAVQTDNVAAVLVTAEVPAFSKPGQRLDINISAIGTATSLRGGNLIMTELRGIDGQVYALAQGPLSVTGVSAQGADSSLEIGVPTSARIPNGAVLEAPIESPFAASDHIIFNVRDMDFSTTDRIATAINSLYGEGTAVPLDGVSVAVTVPADAVQKIGFISDLQNMEIEPGEPTARVVINSRTGTAVINRSVRVTAAAVSHGTLTVRVDSINQVSQPQPFSDGVTVGVQNADLSVDEEFGSMFVFDAGVELQEIVDALNQVRVTPSSLIAILEALKRAGSLRAELVVI